MVKRNKALELECIRAIEGGGGQILPGSELEKSSLEKEKAELDQAIAMSQAVHMER